MDNKIKKPFYAKRISPAFDIKNVPIIFESSQLFAPYLSVAILSLMETASDQFNYDIVILASEIAIADQRALIDLAKDCPNISIRFFDPTILVEKYIARARYRYLYLNYYRMALPWILSKYDKVINLGVDVLIRHDIAELYYQNIGDAPLGGVVDLGYIGRLALDISPKELGLKDPYDYVNADVLVFNLSKIREMYSQEQMMQVWQDRNFRCAEQDALNVMFDNQIYHYDLKWNAFPRKMSSEYDVRHTSSALLLRWEESLRDPYIVHYAAVPKPWQLPTVEFGVAWWGIARKSPFYESMLSNMCEYIEQHGLFEVVESRARTALKKYAPLGSFRRTCLVKICPKGSKRWCFLKKLYYRFFKNGHSCEIEK